MLRSVSIVSGAGFDLHSDAVYIFFGYRVPGFSFIMSIYSGLSDRFYGTVAFSAFSSREHILIYEG